MEKNNQIQNQVDNAFNALNIIENVDVNPLFKEQFLQKLNKEKEVRRMFGWFTPQLQMAAMIIVLLVNSTVILYTFKNENTSKIESFAQEFGLNTEETNLIN